MASGLGECGSERVEFGRRHADVQRATRVDQQVTTGGLQECREFRAQVVVCDRSMSNTPIRRFRRMVCHRVRQVSEYHAGELARKQFLIARQVYGVRTDQAMAAQFPYVS